MPCSHSAAGGRGVFVPHRVRIIARWCSDDVARVLCVYGAAAVVNARKQQEPNNITKMIAANLDFLFFFYQQFS